MGAVQWGAGAALTLWLKLLLLPSFHLALPTSCLLFSPTSHSPLWLHLPALVCSTLLTASVATISDVNDALPWLWLPLL